MMGETLIGGGQSSAPGGGSLPDILALLTQGLNATFNPEQQSLAELAQLQVSPGEIGDIMGSMPFGAAGAVGRAARSALRGRGTRVGAGIPGNPESTLLPSELTRLRLLSDEQQKLQKIAFREIKQGSKSAESRQGLIQLDEIAEEIDQLTSTARNRFKNLFGGR